MKFKEKARDAFKEMVETKQRKVVVKSVKKSGKNDQAAATAQNAVEGSAAETEEDRRHLETIWEERQRREEFFQYVREELLILGRTWAGIRWSTRSRSRYRRLPALTRTPARCKAWTGPTFQIPTLFTHRRHRATIPTRRYTLPQHQSSTQRRQSTLPRPRATLHPHRDTTARRRGTLPQLLKKRSLGQ
jgi:hypothetical protein